MKKLATLLLLTLISIQLTAQGQHFFADINKFGDINDYMDKKFIPVRESGNFDKKGLAKLEEISKHLEAYSEDPSLGSTYYGYVKRCLANYYYIAGRMLQNCRGFYQNRELKDFATNYFRRSIATETSYNHLAFSSSLKFTFIDDVSVDMQNGGIHTQGTKATYTVKSSLAGAHKYLSIIQLSDDMPDSALMNYVTSLDVTYGWRPLEHFTKQELSAVLSELASFADKCHNFNRDYVQFCLLSLQAVGVKESWDYKRQPIDIEVAEKIDHLVSLAARSSSNIQYAGDLAYSLDLLDCDLMVPPFYHLDIAGKLSYTEYAAIGLVRCCTYLLKTKQASDSTRLMMETLIKDNFVGYMENKFRDDDQLDKKRVTEYGYGELLWYQSLADKYPVSDKAGKLLDERIKNCRKKFKDKGPRPFSYKETVLFVPPQQ